MRLTRWREPDPPGQGDSPSDREGPLLADKRIRQPLGEAHGAPITFAGKTEAARWLTLKGADLARSGWIDPAAGHVALANSRCSLAASACHDSEGIATAPVDLVDRSGRHTDFESEPDAFVFTGAKGARSCAGQPFKGAQALAAAGLTGRIHLRRTGNSWAAEAGATLRDLMGRIGHASTPRGPHLHPLARHRHAVVAQAISETSSRWTAGRCQDGR